MALNSSGMQTLVPYLAGSGRGPWVSGVNRYQRVRPVHERQRYSTLIPIETIAMNCDRTRTTLDTAADWVVPPIRLGPVDAARPETVSLVERKLTALGVTTRPLVVDAADYHRYLDRARYQERWPEYFPTNLPEKSLEHYLAIQLLQPVRHDRFLDIAAGNSPLAEIVEGLVGCEAYAQDLIFSPGVHGRYVGGDACALPFEAGSISKAALTCSFEHFEGDADIRLFTELSRVLCGGGKVVVVPLYLNSYHAIQVDPRAYSEPLRVDPSCVVHLAPGWGNRHGRFYSPESLLERITLRFSTCFHFQLHRVVNTESLSPEIYVRWALLAERL